MPLIGNTANPALSKVSDKSMIELSYHLLLNGAIAEGYQILKELEPSATEVCVFVNLGLCYIWAMDWQSALTALEKAENMVKKLSQPQPLKDSTLTKLLEIQSGSPHYTYPMHVNFPLMLPECAKDNILRLMIDMCLRLDMFDRVQKIATALQGKNYKNVEDSVKYCRSKQK